MIDFSLVKLRLIDFTNVLVSKGCVTNKRERACAVDSIAQARSFTRRKGKIETY